MRVTFILPAVGKKKGRPYISSWKMEPLTIAVLAGITPQDIEIKFYDDRLESIPYDEPTDLVALSVETYTAKKAYQIAQRFRRRGVKVVMGGYHPTLVPFEAAEHADSVVIGEAEGLWERLLSDFQNNHLRKFYWQKKRPSLAGIRPRREIYKDKKYLPLTLVETGRGCSMRCNFCCINVFYKYTYNFRPVEDIVEEIVNTGKKNFFFVDDNITHNPARAKKLFLALIPLKIRWISQASLSCARTKSS